MSLSPQAFKVERNGLELVGDRWDADPSHGVVLLLHGGGQTRHSWKKTAARLAAAGWTAIALDARGHGDSGWDPAADYSLDAFIGDLLAVVGTLDERPVFVGASLGGITSLVAAGEHSGLGRGLVLVDVVPRVEPAGVARIRDFLSAHHAGFATLDDVADAISAYNPTRQRPRNLEGLKKNVRQRSDGRWYWHWDPAFMRNPDEPQRHTDPLRLRAAAAQVDMPILIVRGAQSDVVSDASIADMLELVPTASYVDVPAAGHMVAGDDNDVFAANLEGFLAGLEPRHG